MSDDLALTVQRAIRAERARLGLSQSDLASRIGWSRSQIAALETGARRLYVHELPEICEGLETSLLTLLSHASRLDRERLRI